MAACDLRHWGFTTTVLGGPGVNVLQNLTSNYCFETILVLESSSNHRMLLILNFDLALKKSLQINKQKKITEFFSY